MQIGSPTEKQTAFVVEDCDELRYILVRLLSRRGFGVRAFETAPDALNAWEQSQGANLLVTDVTLPRMTGVELLRELQARRALAGTGVLIVTAATDLMAPLPGAVMLTKPFAVASFDRAVEQALSQHLPPVSAS